MKTDPTYYNNLISRYFLGEASAEEIAVLEKWVEAAPENRKVFQEYGKTWKAIEKSGTGPTIDLDQEWTALKHKMSGNPHPVSHGLYPDSPLLNPVSRLFPNYLFRIAALFLLLAIPAFLLYHYYGPPKEKHCVAGREVVSCTLPDGTLVTLNAGSTLVFPEKFTNSSRLVTLTGEAWFEVAPDPAKPFVITTDNIRIEVVGTSFLVNTRKGKDASEIILATGKVKACFKDRPDDDTILSPGEKTIFLTEGYTINKEVNTDMNYLSWKTKQMVFNNTPLSEVVTLLNKVYRNPVRILENNLNNCRITATFDHQSLESVLNVLKATLDLQIQKTSSGFEISGHGCR